MALYVMMVTTLGALTLAAFALALGLGTALAIPGGRDSLRRVLRGQERHPIGWGWGVSLVATLGSLYLSEIAHLVPCTLCWYQRIAMYPLVPVLGVGLMRSDAGVWRYALPLPVVGLAIAAYHVTIQWMPSLEVVTCSSAAPCTGRYLAVFGFISIPTMAGGAFLLITTLLLLVAALEKEEEYDQLPLLTSTR